MNPDFHRPFRSDIRNMATVVVEVSDNVPARDRRITIAFRPDAETQSVRFLLASFGGQNRSATAATRL